QETAICLPFIRRHIELAGPEVLLLLGNTPAQALLEKSEGITRLRGRWQEVMIGGGVLPAMPSFHPAYLLRQPAQKKFAWRDLLALSNRLCESDGDETNKT
ncbi:MAG: uracil-DNA glycosylase, partial [Rhizobiaceae bacterium]